MTQWDYSIFWLCMQLPMLMVCYVGFMVALGRWKRHPNASLLTVLGVAILMINGLIWILVSDVPLELFKVSVIARHAVLALGVALILVAALRKRMQRPVLAHYDDLYDPLPQESARPKGNLAPDDAIRKGTNP
jgi:hypothetical protein